MEKKIISIPTNEKKIYRQILMFMNFMLDLTSQEQSVLAEIIRLDNEYEMLPADKRSKFILSTDMRKEMCDNLKIKDTHFNVIFNKLRKKTIFKTQLLIDEQGVLNPMLKFKPDNDGFKIEVNFINTILKETPVKQQEYIPPSDTPPSTNEEESTEDRKLATPSNEAEVVDEGFFDFELT